MKRKGTLFRFVILALDVVLAVWIYTSYKKTTSADPKETQPSVIKTTESPTAPPKTTAVPKTTAAPDTSAAPETTKSAETTPVPETPASQETASSDTGHTVSPETLEKLDRFSWYLDNVMLNGVPQNAVKITDPSRLFGPWKVLLYCDPDGPAERMVLADAAADAGQFGFVVSYEKTLTYVPQTGEATEHFSIDADVFPFSEEEGLIRIETDEGDLLLYCYELDGRCYGTGAFSLKDGTGVYAAAVQDR